MSEEEKNNIERLIKQNYIDNDDDIIGILKKTLNYINELEKENEELKEELEKVRKHEQEYENGDIFSAKQMHIIDEEQGKLLNRIKKLKRENEALEIIHETYKEVVDNGNFISKDKIKAKIKELEDKKEQYEEQPLIYHILKNQLEELLEE